MYDYLVFIARANPLHNGHMQVIKEALGQSTKLIILLGSANVSRSPRNPFTIMERKVMVALSLVNDKEINENNVSIIDLDDSAYNEQAWIAQVQRKVYEEVRRIERRSDLVMDRHIGLIGYAKDDSSYYLKLFPNWSSCNVVTHFDHLNSTDIRNRYFTHGIPPTTRHCPENISNFMYNFLDRDEFKWLAQYHRRDESYKALWASAPYPVIITCVDAVVIQSGHVLLVKRDDNGLLALPGGHVEHRETFRNAVIRELREETKISDHRGEIPPAMLESFIDDTKTRLFDNPYRSSRARVVTQAYYFDLPARKEMFSVIGSDDAADAHWYPLGELDPTQFHEDHAMIIEYMTGI